MNIEKETNNPFFPILKNPNIHFLFIFLALIGKAKQTPVLTHNNKYLTTL